MWNPGRTIACAASGSWVIRIGHRMGKNRTGGLQMEALNSKTYHAAVYLRLSREDGDVAEGGKALSNSISNQKELVMDYLRSHAGIQVYSTYVDDGWSGVDFERPEFQRMLSDIREGSVDCVVVKDLSRFGRNYIESGRYIEKIFPMLGVRFIAVNDGYDSLNEQYGNDMVIPFKNLIKNIDYLGKVFC